MTPESNSLIPVRRRRRLRNSAKVLTQPLPLTPMNWMNAGQICAPIAPRQVNPVPADPFRYAFGKVLLAFGSWGIDERIKELQRTRHDGTKSDQQWNQVEAFLLPLLKKLVDDMRTRC